MASRTFLIVCICLCTIICNAQENILFTSYGVDDGLAQSTVIDIIQDNNGFIWASTPDGLSRFDGYDFHNYKNISGDSTSINTNREETFYIDSTHRLWILTYRGVCLYDPFKDRFNNVITYDPQHVVTTVNCIYGEDKDNIYASFCGYGFVAINQGSFNITRINIPGDTAHFAALMYYKGFLDNGKVWLCNNDLAIKNNFLIYDIKTHISETIPVSLNNLINLSDSEALGLSDSSVVVIKKKDHTFSTYQISGYGGFSTTNTICRLSPTEVIISSYTSGLLYFNTVSGKITKRIATLGRNEKNNLYARCAYPDRSGNLWIGTSADGLKKNQSPFKKFKYYNSNSSKGNIVRSIYADSTTLYIGYFNNGFDIFSRKGGFIKNVAMPFDVRNNAYVIAPLSLNKLLLMGNSPINKKDNNLPVIYDIPAGNIKIIGSSLESMLPEKETNVPLGQFLYNYGDGILAALGGYLVILRNSGNQVVPEVVHYFPKHILTCCHIDGYGFIWIGSYSDAWCCKHGSWNKVKQLPDIEVKTIAHDHTGNAWLGTVKGIYVYDSSLNLIHHYDESNGLVNEHIYGLLCSNDGDMWFSHNKGISVFRQQGKTFINYTRDDGLQSNEFNAGAYFKSSDGELFFGGINGTTSFYPQEIYSNPNKPEVRITDIKLFDKPYKTDSAYWNIHTISLPYDQNNLSFEFSALEYTNSKKNRYAYMMDGLDKTWVNVGDKRFVRYPALPPGNYIFKVKAANNDGLWNDVPTTLFISIIPPFWQRTWFYVLCVLGFTGIIAWVVRVIDRQRHIKEIRALEMQHKIQLERERISRDLHDNVGTQLSLINNNLEWIADPMSTLAETEKNKKLTSIRQTTGEMMSTLRETIWALKKEKIKSLEFFDKLKGYITKQLEMYPPINIQFSEPLSSEEIVLGASEALHLFRICQEAVVNSLKYAEATALTISFSVTQGKYIIQVADNGLGFNPEGVNTQDHFGLGNMKFRAGEIGCSFEIITTPGTGTTIRLTKK